jgi:hypothetical protein
MDTRSKKLVELFEKIKTAIGQGDVCAPYQTRPSAEPGIELTVKTKRTGQIITFHLWQVAIEQWQDIDPLTKTPVAGSPTHLKIIGDVAKSGLNLVADELAIEQMLPIRKEEPKEEPKP